MTDPSHYTPPELAELLVSCVRAKPRNVADFCVGDGSLIKAALKRWPDLNCSINDVDASALTSAVQCCNPAIVQCADFLDPSQFPSNTEVRPANHDLILMNPPFCVRGRKKWSPRGRHSDVICGQALAFVLTAVNYLSLTGEILAILPSATLYSERDDHAMSILRSEYEFEVLFSPDDKRFPKVSASTFIARIARRSKGNFTRDLPSAFASRNTNYAFLKRGTVSVVKEERTKTADWSNAWIHTTSIRNGRIEDPYLLPEKRSDNGFASQYSIVLPRVGKITRNSLAPYSERNLIYMSDCLISIACSDAASLHHLHKLLLGNFDTLSSLYGGTGAPYITLSKLGAFVCDLLGLGAPSDHRLLISEVFSTAGADSDASDLPMKLVLKKGGYR